jgi:hypothetical protein
MARSDMVTGVGGYFREGMGHSFSPWPAHLEGLV